jgi:hypothetical protein
MTTTDNELFCKLCNYSARCISDWYKHLSSKKHKRDGEKVSKSCSICNITFTNHWLLKKHYLNNHATIDERKKQKYYCELCDVVFFAKLYCDTHFKGIKHNNRAKLKETIDQVNERVKFLENKKLSEQLI